jgi:hypothetical protein
MIRAQCTTGHPQELTMNVEDPNFEVPPRTTGTIDDDDEPEDESAEENEAPIRETSDRTELPEEFELDDEDSLGHPEDDDAET